MNDINSNQNISPVLIRLLKGALYRDQYPVLWQDLNTMKGPVMDYISVIGLECIIDELEGYAYLRQKKNDGDEIDEDDNIPRLVQKRAFSYPVSLLCVLLRKKLIEADAGGENSRVILKRDEIVEMIRLFLPDAANEVKIIDQVDTHINKIIEIGFLRKMKNQDNIYEIRRIIKAFVDADWIASMDEKMKVYREYINEE